MSLYQTSLLSLISRLGRLGLDEWYEGTVTSGGNNTIADTSRYEADDYFQNLTPAARVRIISTTDGLAPYGQERTITDWAQSSGSATVHANWATSNPAAGDKYVFLSKYQWSELKEAINAAIDLAGTDGHIEKIDESVKLVADVREYILPAGFTVIYRVSMEDSSGNYPEAIPPDSYRIIRGGPTPKLHFDTLPEIVEAENINVSQLWGNDQITADRYLRIEGLQKQPLLEVETDICYLNPEYVWRQAAAILASKKIRSAPNDPDEHRAQYILHQAEADRLRKEMFPGLPPNSKRVV